MEETLEVAPSADQGNVPIDVEATEVAPSEPSEPAAPAEPAEPAPPAEPQLYELPDGRKVDAETLSKEWKENFYPEFTRKSQELAAVKAPLTEPKPANPLEDPNYIPQTYAELAQKIKEDTLRDIETRKKAEVDARTALENEVASQLDEIKKADPNISENELFLHANKYGLRDLRQAHQNMKDMREMVKKAQQTTAANITKRADPVSVSPGATGARPDPTSFSTARDYLRSLKT